MPMKCQRCPKPGTVHITEVLGGGKYEEAHLCEGCAKAYLNAADPGKPAAGEAGAKCEACGISFVEFRNHGRFGCPHDYDAFRTELLPLLNGVHGEVKHAGKSPRKHPAPPAPGEVAALRKRLAQAVAAENYEEAAKIRDRLRAVGGLD